MCVLRTGKFHRCLTPSAEERNQIQYECATLMSNIWGWQHHPEISPLHHFFETENVCSINYSQNTLALQAHQFFWDTNKGDYCDPVMERGHWGPNIGPGIGATRKSTSGVVRIPKFSWTGEQKTTIQTSS